MKTLNQYISLSNEKISSIDDYIIEKLKLKNVKTYTFSDASIEYWKDELGFDPTEIDYSQNEAANKIINKFKSNNKLTELFDYLVSGLTDKMSKYEWINYVSYTNIKDYESYNGPIDEKLKLKNIKKCLDPEKDLNISPQNLKRIDSMIIMATFDEKYIQNKEQLFIDIYNSIGETVKDFNEDMIKYINNHKSLEIIINPDPKIIYNELKKLNKDELIKYREVELE